MWTPTTRVQHSRAGLRYGSDLTDAEWEILLPFLPAEARCGRKRAWPMREVVNAICYVLRGGIAWRLTPDSFPPGRTVYRWFARLRDDGTWQTINHHLVMRSREQSGRAASPMAAVMDRQSVKTTESGGIRGYDAGKKIKGRKRHALVHTDGRALKLQVHAVDIQDRDGSGPLLRASRSEWPFVQLAYADAGYQGPRVAAASSIRVKIMHKPKGQIGFALHARRWAELPKVRVQSTWKDSGGGRALPRMDQPQSPPCQGGGSNHRISRNLPLRRLSHHPSAQVGSLMKRFETDFYQPRS